MDAPMLVSNLWLNVGRKNKMKADFKHKYNQPRDLLMFCVENYPLTKIFLL